MELTLEQVGIVGAIKNVQVQAITGAGLTTTLTKIVERNPDRRILYLTATEQDRKLLKRSFRLLQLSHARVETPCSLARKKLGLKVFQVRQHPFAPHEIIELLSIQSSDVVKNLRIAYFCGQLLHYFSNSSHQTLEENRFEKTIYDTESIAFYWKHAEEIVQYTQMILNMMQQLSIPILPSYCLKLYERLNPKLNSDLILVDGAQHINPCFANVLRRQDVVQIIGGDPNLHQFRGGQVGNLLYQCRHPKKTLSTSFRFEPDIANQARMVLGMKKMLFENFEAPSILGTKQVPGIKTLAVIGKQKHTVLNSAMILMAHHKNLAKLHFEGGFKKYLVTDDGISIYDILYLYIGERSRIQHPFIRSISSINELEEYAAAIDAEDCLGFIDIVKRHRKGLPDLIRELRRNLIKRKDPKDMADVIYASLAETLHQTYDQVNLLEDFMTIKELKSLLENEHSADYKKMEKELNQLYEACTKARIKLSLPDEFLPDSQGNLSIEYEAVELENVDHFDLTGRESLSDRQEIIYSLDRQKRTHKNTFSKWTSEDENSLKQLQKQSASIDDISRKLNRTKSSVTMRLRKLKGK